MFSYANGVPVVRQIDRQTDKLELWQPKDAMTGAQQRRRRHTTNKQQRQHKNELRTHA